MDDQTKQDVVEITGTENFDEVFNDLAAQQAAKEAPQDAPEPEKEAKPEGEKQPSEAAVKDKPEQEAKPEGEQPPTPTEEDYAEWKKAFENRESWQKSLKQKSQAMKWWSELSEEQQAVITTRMMPYVYKQEQIPDTPDDLVEQVVGKVEGDIPEYLSVKLEYYDEEVKIPKEQYAPIIQNLVKKALKETYPELNVVRKDYAKLKEDMDNASQYVGELERQNGEITLNYFAVNYPDAIPQRNDGESAAQAIMRVLESGDDHPEYNKVVRIQAAANLRSENIKKGNAIPFEKAFETLYGVDVRRAAQEKKAKEQIAEKQAKSQAEEPGRATPDDPNAYINELLPNSHLRHVDDILNKELGH